jgi:hypothetical protein
MQIHEIARQKADEGILKGVANNVGTTLKGAGQGLGMAAAGVGKAGLNTAEYFANKILNAAGVPADQQGRYSKYGHIAAGQRQGVASIARQEQEIANELAKEWASTGTLNGVKSDLITLKDENKQDLKDKDGNPVQVLDSQDIKRAALQKNAAAGNLEIDADNVIEIVQTLAPQYVKDRKEQQVARARGQLNIKNLMAELEKQYAISKDPSQPITNKQQAIDVKNKVIDTLKQLGQPVDQKYLDDTTTSAQSAIVKTGGAPLLTATPPAAKAPVAPAASPAGFNYNNIMKMPGMNTPVKKPATTPTAVKKPVPAMAESLTWSKNFDPSRQLYRRMKQGQTQ